MKVDQLCFKQSRNTENCQKRLRVAWKIPFASKHGYTRYTLLYKLNTASNSLETREMAREVSEKQENHFLTINKLIKAVMCTVSQPKSLSESQPRSSLSTKVSN